jgi:hypothetical protein
MGSPWNDQPVAAGDVTGVDVDRLRRDLERLRAENVRLSRLLELRGLDATPSPEQLATGVPRMVTMASPVVDKLALFADRFAARTDMYALRWENRRSGAAGWMPAVAGGWRKGMNRQSAAYLELSADVVAAHLVGDVFVGLYPLLARNTCRFLVADFDGPTAMLDALAYTKAARAGAVPAAVEISQSGRGAHVWVFFTSAVPAALARTVGTALIHEAMVLRGSMDLRSYDRLFPSQDVLPDGGFGNLIAAPLHGRRRKDGLTLFLDLATLEPYEDQWAFLSTVDRLSPGEAEGVARRVSRAVVGGEITTLSRSQATRVHPPLPAVIHAELSATLRVDSAQLPAAALATFKHAASMANPKFYELQRLRKSTWDTPRFVRGYDLTLDDHLVLPRGLRHAITDLVERAGSRLTITDTRNSGHEIDAAPSSRSPTSTWRRQASQSALELAAQGGGVVRGTADMYVAISQIALARGDVGAAVENLRRGHAVGEHPGLPQNPYRWRLVMARIRQVQGDLAGALDLVEEAQRVYVADFTPPVDGLHADHGGSGSDGWGADRPRAADSGRDGGFDGRRRNDCRGDLSRSSGSDRAGRGRVAAICG